jgi:hypothetical protein
MNHDTVQIVILIIVILSLLLQVMGFAGWRR